MNFDKYKTEKEPRIKELYLSNVDNELVKKAETVAEYAEDHGHKQG